MQVNMNEAKSQLAKLIAAAEAGEDVVIARLGKPAVRLVPLRSGGFRFGTLAHLATPCRTLTSRWSRMSWRSGRAGVERGPAGQACMDLESRGAGQVAAQRRPLPCNAVFVSPINIYEVTREARLGQTPEIVPNIVELVAEEETISAPLTRAVRTAACNDLLAEESVKETAARIAASIGDDI